MTFLDSGDGSTVNDTTGFTLAYAILSVASFICVAQGIWETSRKHYLYDRYSLKILFPWASFVQSLENATIAYDVSGETVNKSWASIIYALQATVPASLLLSTFDVTYSIHKTRSILFCGIVDGHTRSKNPRISMLLKMAMRLVSLCLIGVGIAVNFDLVKPNNPLAGRVGWYYLVTEPWAPDSLHVLLGILPSGTSSMASFYFSVALWRYGTSYSMVVHASPCNPWFSPFFGTIALVGSQWFDVKWYLLLSNLGIFVYVESILLLFMEVNKDMEATTDLVHFLEDIGGGRRQAQQIQGNSGTNVDDVEEKKEEIGDSEAQ